MSKKLDDLLARQDELKQARTIIIDLCASPGWQWLEETLKANHRSHRQQEFAREITSLDVAFNSATFKGIISGLQIALTTPHQALEDCETDLLRIESEISEAQDE